MTVLDSLHQSKKAKQCLKHGNSPSKLNWAKGVECEKEFSSVCQEGKVKFKHEQELSIKMVI